MQPAAFHRLTHRVLYITPLTFLKSTQANLPQSVHIPIFVEHFSESVTANGNHKIPYRAHVNNKRWNGRYLLLFCQSKGKVHVLQHFFQEIFGMSRKTSYLCIRFWERTLLQNSYWVWKERIKKEFFEKITINREVVVQEADFASTLYNKDKKKWKFG